MNIIIIGAGQVGSYLAQLLVDRNHNVTLIDDNPDLCHEMDAAYDARIIQGNGSSAHVLAEAGVHTCDVLLAMTSDDRTNIMACSIGKALGAKLTICRAHDHTYLEASFVNYQLHFNIDLLVNPEALCAAQLAKTIRNPDHIAVESFSRGSLITQQITISKSSAYEGLTLQAIQMPQDTRMLYLERGNEIIIPSSSTVLQDQDQATILGTPETLARLKERLYPESATQTRNVIVYSASETALSLVRLLRDPRFKIHVIEKDKALCDHVVGLFPDITVIHGDGTSLKLLQEEQVGACDFFVACSKNDENNIMTAIQANRLGAKHTQILVNKPDYEPIMESLTTTLGIQQTVSPRLATATEAMRLISEKPYTELAPIPQNVGKIIELKVDPTSSVVGHTLAQIRLPKPTLVLLLTHKYQGRVPGPQDLVLAGDRLAILVTNDNLAEVVSLFTTGELG
ncbi:MAG: Trk system potassium transport protein TrkA [Verrucomicrobia bacterium 21-51-4]|nr:MAG: Trk system potassium transport protein TrkA [Verrucomicrobia bacterium 21-51-4]HQU08612.1 Trk system potassium transporter TrkA [Opitutales bacterium]